MMRILPACLSLLTGCLLLTGCSRSGEQLSRIDPENGTVNTEETMTKPEQTTTEETTTVTETTAPRIRNLVTLGDSISAGYGLEQPEAQRYSALLVQKLAQADGISWNDYNYAVSGDDSSDLMKLLQDGTASALSDADLICLYIGANNLLGPYTDYLKSAAQVFQKPESGNGAASWIGQIAGAVSSNIQSFTKINEKVEEGMDRLTKDLPDTYSLIRSRNADAPIYLMTVYNPYRFVTLSNPVSKESFGEYTGTKIDRLNGIIQSFAASHPDVSLVDIHAAFEELDTVPILGNINESSAEGAKTNPDPHPNLEGQKLIAETIYSAMRVSQ